MCVCYGPTCAAMCRIENFKRVKGILSQKYGVGVWAVTCARPVLLLLLVESKFMRVRILGLEN
jgi:hypothetical protein